MTTQLLTRKQAAEYLRVSVDAIRKYEKKGLLKPIGYVMNKPRYSLESVQGFIVSSKK